MPTTTTPNLRRLLNDLFPANWVRRAGRDTQAIKRQRQVDINDLFWALTLGFSSGSVRSLAALRRSYQTLAGHTIEESAFQKRFHQGLVALFKRACDHALENMPGLLPKLSGRLENFTDVQITDASVVRLHDYLQDKYPGTRTNHSKASLKTHLVMSVTGARGHRLTITDGRHGDGKAFTLGPWVKGTLLLFDLAYAKYANFAQIDQEGGYFVSRIKTNANPIVTDNHVRCRGNSKVVVEKGLQDVLATVRRQLLDVQADYRVNKRQTVSLRTVALRNRESGLYHLYVTNLPPELFDAEAIALFYTLRWQIELLFKELKSRYRMDHMPSRREETVQTLIYAAMVTCFVSRSLFAAICKHLNGAAKRARVGLWAILFEELAPILKLLVSAPANVASYLEKQVWPQIVSNVLDPNIKRQTLVENVQTGSLSWW